MSSSGRFFEWGRWPATIWCLTWLVFFLIDFRRLGWTIRPVKEIVKINRRRMNCLPHRGTTVSSPMQLCAMRDCATATEDSPHGDDVEMSPHQPKAAADVHNNDHVVQHDLEMNRCASQDDTQPPGNNCSVVLMRDMPSLDETSKEWQARIDAVRFKALGAPEKNQPSSIYEEEFTRFAAFLAERLVWEDETYGISETSSSGEFRRICNDYLAYLFWNWPFNALFFWTGDTSSSFIRPTSTKNLLFNPVMAAEIAAGVPELLVRVIARLGLNLDGLGGLQTTHFIRGLVLGFVCHVVARLLHKCLQMETGYYILVLCDGALITLTFVILPALYFMEERRTAVERETSIENNDKTEDGDIKKCHGPLVMMKKTEAYVAGLISCVVICAGSVVLLFFVGLPLVEFGLDRHAIASRVRRGVFVGLLWFACTGWCMIITSSGIGVGDVSFAGNSTWPTDVCHVYQADGCVDSHDFDEASCAMVDSWTRERSLGSSFTRYGLLIVPLVTVVLDWLLRLDIALFVHFERHGYMRLSFLFGSLCAHEYA